MQIGEIKLTDHKTAVVPCEIPATSVVKTVLMDSSNLPRWEDKFTLSKSVRSLELNLPRLANGIYHLWITVDEKTFIRTVKIDRPWLPGLFYRFSNTLNMALPFSFRIPLLNRQ